MNTHGKYHPNSLERDERANENIPASAPIEKGLPPTEEASADQSLTLKIEKMIYGGWGLARQAPCDPSKAEEGRRVIFVPDVLPGEQILATLTTPRKGYAKAKLTKILIPSPERKSPPCPVFGTCGGCHLQHMSDTAQLAYKQEVLLETLQRIGHIHASPLPIIPSPDSYHYRHRVQFKLFRQESHLKMCYYQRESHHFVPVEGCPILHPDLEHAMKVLRESLESGLPFLLNPTEMHLQYSTHTAQVLIVFYAQEVRPDGLGELFASLKARLPVAGIVAYSKNGRREVRGQPFLLESLKGVTIRISDRTFAQPNWPMNELITDLILAFAQLKGNETVLELYSGMGNFSVFLAKQAARVITMESSPQAVKDAKINARVNNVMNLEFYCCEVEKGLVKLLRNRRSIDLIVLDPPRQGAGQAVLKRISGLQSPRILYLSCEPTTLARDIKCLLQHGYRLGRIQPFDLFPQTYHLEVLAELEKIG